MQELETKTADGTILPLSWFPAMEPRAALVLFPALGIQCKLYNKLAAGLAETGCSVCLVEQRGHGRSPIPVRRGTNYRLGDFLDTDIPAALAWVQERHAGVPLFLGGHSLGGHLATIYAGQHPHELAGIVHLACAFPFYGVYQGRNALQIRMLRAFIKLFRFFPGYYPGNRVGFGGRESIAMMQEWSEWAGTGRFDFGERKNLADCVANFSGPVISVSFDRDDFSTEAAVDLALSPFTASTVTRVKLGATEQGEHLGHTGWARDPKGVVQALGNWLPG